jgi:hypothetical protein
MTRLVYFFFGDGAAHATQGPTLAKSNGFLPASLPRVSALRDTRFNLQVCTYCPAFAHPETNYHSRSQRRWTRRISVRSR